MSIANNGQDRGMQLPGLGRPVNDFPFNPIDEHEKKRLRFPHAIADNCDSIGIRARERRMLEFINNITDKPEWEQKVFDEAIVAKWREEGCVWSESLDDDYLTQDMYFYCIQELRDKAEYYKQSRLVSVYDCEAAIAKSDVIVSTELAGSLRECVRVLEDVPEHAKDWHPGSDEKVLDLLHPSLFPLVYGTSKALSSGIVPLYGCEQFIGKGDTVDALKEQDREYVMKKSFQDTTLKAWGSFQWLPSEIHFSEDGSCQITSYVNNLAPNVHKNMYGVLAQFVTVSIPLWNECLSWFEKRFRFEQKHFSDDDFGLPEGVEYPHPRTVIEDAEDSDGEPKYDSDDSDYRDWFDDNKVLFYDEAKIFKSRQMWESEPDHRPVDLQKDFHDSGLQVIFKLANIHLTPEEPDYKGGSWHIEGALNEHICATAIYYYDEENITESRLGFRQSFDTESLMMRHEQNEFESLEIYYGVRTEETTIQTLGSVLTRSGRLLAFPNVLQHQVQPFKLADPSKPGHRKILAMFLVDPYVRIPSTANVPPQQMDWWASELLKMDLFNSLPGEIFNLIMEFVGFPFSWEDAVKIRQELMNERGALENNINNAKEEDTFFFCEH